MCMFVGGGVAESGLELIYLYTGWVISKVPF